MTLPSVAHTAEFQRVAGLPRRVWSAADLAWLTSELTALLRTPAGAREGAALRPVQALALHDAGIEGGLFGAIGVGEGKTLIELLLSLVWGAKRPLMMLPATLIEKTQHDQLRYSQHWRIPNNLRLFSYELLGRVQSENELERYAPDVLILEEAHKLKNRRAACTRRVARYMYKHPETRVAALSGTVMSKSLKDFAHLLLWSLKLRAPVPLRTEEIEEWASALDLDVEAMSRLKPGALLEFAAERTGDETVDARRGFQKRLVETPGVVATVGDGERVDASIYVRAIRHAVSPATENNFRTLREDWCTPEGWELAQASEVWQHAQELALGLHYTRVDRKLWRCLTRLLKKSVLTTENIVREISKSFAPTIESARKLRSGERDIKHTSCELDTALISASINSLSNTVQAAATSAAGRLDGIVSPLTTTTSPELFEDISALLATERSGFSETRWKACKELLTICVELARPSPEYLSRRSAWTKFVRSTLARSRTYDSDLQVANAVLAGHVDDSGVLKNWLAVRDLQDIVPIPIWHDDSALHAVAEWVREQGSAGGLVWTEHTFFAERLSKVTGLPYYGRKGYSAAGAYIEHARPGTSAIASIDANREGKNLQGIWSRNLLVCPPASAEWVQQVIARTHRPGQAADEVIVDVLLGCRENFDNCMKALAGAQAIQDTTGNQQKLLLADVTFPSEAEIEKVRSPRWVR